MYGREKVSAKFLLGINNIEAAIKTDSVSILYG